MSQLSINLFGSPIIEVDNHQIEISRRKAVALFAYLAVTGKRHSRDALAALLWPEADQRRAKAGLRSALWNLNKSPLQEWLLVGSETIGLQSDAAAELDVARFRRLIAAPEGHDHPSSAACPACLEPLTAAVNLYQDDFMAGFTLPDAPQFDEWQFFQTNGLRESLATTLKRLIQFWSTEEDFDRAIIYGRRYVDLDHLHEPAHHALMQLYARSGQQAAALRQYQICRETLEAELGIRPSEETRKLFEQIRSGKWRKRENQKANIIDPVPSGANPHNLPPNPNRLVGRERELSRMSGYLSDPATRLITIVGPGGIGKTRLALAAAREELSESRFSDGIYFVSLAPIAEPEAMLALIAETVGYPLQSEQRTSQQQLLDYFRQKSMLLVLDNFEHLLTGAAFVSDLLQHAPQVKVVATSRERLNLYEEQQYLLGGLAFPGSNTDSEITDYPAVVLFLQCARRQQPDFEAAPAELASLAEICRLLEGMPLGLELAAAWSGMLPLRKIVAEFRRNLDFLATDVRNVPDRHRSMRAVFDTSWQRLSETDRRIYARLSVFHGGFTAEAARVVTGASLKTLASLVNRSLLRPSQGGERYEIHELLRQYTAAKLGESETEEASVRDHHAAYYCAFLQQREDDLKGARQQEVLGEIEADIENASAAWRWAAEREQIGQLARALVPLGLFYQWNGRLREGKVTCQMAIEKLAQAQPAAEGESQARLMVKLLIWQSIFDTASANYDVAAQALRQARAILEGALLGDKDTVEEQAFLLLQLSEVAKIKSFEEALALNEQSLSLYRSIRDPWGVAQAIDALNAKHQSLGNYGTAVKLQKECLAIRQELNDPRGIARSYSYLGHYLLFAGQIEASERYLRMSLEQFRAMGARADSRNPLLLLGINLLFGGKFAESVASSEACWAIHRELGMPHEPGSASVGIARAKINLGLYEEARNLSEANLINYRSLNHKWYIAFALLNLGRIALVEGDVMQAKNQFQESVQLLQEMGDRPLLPDVLFCLAFVYRQLGERHQAIQHLSQALRIAIGSPPLNPMRFELPVMALLLVDEGENERAVELYEAALQSPYIANSRWFATLVGPEIARAAASLEPDEVAAAQKRGRAREPWPTATALLAELEPA